MSSSTVFRFQQRYVFFELSVLWLMVTIFVISIFPPIISYLTYKEILRQALRATIYLNITAFAIFMLYRFIKRDLRQTQIGITDKTIILKRKDSISSLNIEEITRIRFIKMPFIRGFIQLESPSAVLALPLYIENLSGFIESFRSAFKTSANKNLLDSEITDQLIKESFVYSRAYQRSLKAFTPVLFLSLTICLTNAVIAEKIWEFRIIPKLIWAISGLALPIATYFFAEILVNTLIRKKFTHELNDPGISLRFLYILPALIALMVYFFTGITLRIILSWS